MPARTPALGRERTNRNSEHSTLRGVTTTSSRYKRLFRLSKRKGRYRRKPLVTSGRERLLVKRAARSPRVVSTGYVGLCSNYRSPYRTRTPTKCKRASVTLNPFCLSTGSSQSVPDTYIGSLGRPGFHPGWVPAPAFVTAFARQTVGHSCGVGPSQLTEPIQSRP
jgi:hypothetical protein